MAFWKDGSVVSRGSMCDCDDYFHIECHDENPEYFDYDDPEDFDDYPDLYGFVEPDDYELYLHG